VALLRNNNQIFSFWNTHRSDSLGAWSSEEVQLLSKHQLELSKHQLDRNFRIRCGACLGYRLAPPPHPLSGLGGTLKSGTYLCPLRHHSEAQIKPGAGPFLLSINMLGHRQLPRGHEQRRYPIRAGVGACMFHRVDRLSQLNSAFSHQALGHTGEQGHLMRH